MTKYAVVLDMKARNGKEFIVFITDNVLEASDYIDNQMQLNCNEHNAGFYGRYRIDTYTNGAEPELSRL